MTTPRIILPKQFVEYLTKLPENGMGYQLVKVILTNGDILRKHKVFNSSILLLEKQEQLLASQIQNLELETTN